MSSAMSGDASATAGNLSWYAIHVRSRHEFRVQELLTRSGIEAFLPTVDRLRRWKDRKKIVTFALFPGYLFVHIPQSRDAMLAVLKTFGVVQFLKMTPGDPAVVPDAQVESLKKLVASKEAIEPYPYLKEGQRVRIRSGPLAGVEGILKQRRGQHILVLAVDVLQQGASVRVEALDVEPA